MLRKNIYAWHRNLSLFIALPVFLWAVSGLMHPLMTNVKPKIASASITPKPIDTRRIKMGLDEILKKHDIQIYHRFRLISIDTNWFYQIQIHAESKPLYFSAYNGKGLVNGDALYAQYLGRKFLLGENVKDTIESDNTNPISNNEESDCCTLAAACIKKAISKSPITKVEHLYSFDNEYKEINRLLPVYKIAYERKDGIRLYVETTSDRLAYAVDDRRASFDQLFFLLHNWGWMNFAGDLKYVFMSVALALTILTTLMGIYILRITKTVKKNENPALKARYRHRKFAILAFAFTLMFAFSGAFHALEKLNQENKNGLIISQSINTLASPDLKIIQQQIPYPISNISSVIIKDKLYWQVFAIKSDTNSKNPNKEFRKPVVPLVTIDYFDATNHEKLHNGDEKYAAYLATQYSSLPENKITKKERVTKFEGEYGFINKRLPVWKISFSEQDKARYYIETSTGYLSTIVQDSDLWEGLSFAYLHKHHFMDWSGKIGRDISTMFWALVQIVLIATGLILVARRIVR